MATAPEEGAAPANLGSPKKVAAAARRTAKGAPEARTAAPTRATRRPPRTDAARVREPPLTLGFDDEPEPDDDAPAARRSTAGPARPSAGTQGFVVRTDGAARGNPGPASAGAVLLSLARPDARDPHGTPDASISDYLGVQTNNVAEYTAVVRAIGLGLELGARRLELLLDSKLIVEQLAGRWRVKDAKLRPLWAEALQALRTLPDGWTAAHVPRAQNSLADAMCNEAIDRVMAGGPASVVRRPDTPGLTTDRPKTLHVEALESQGQRGGRMAARRVGQPGRREESPSSTVRGSG